MDYNFTLRTERRYVTQKRVKRAVLKPTQFLIVKTSSHSHDVPMNTLVSSGGYTVCTANNLVYLHVETRFTK